MKYLTFVMSVMLDILVILAVLGVVTVVISQLGVILFGG